MIGADRAAAFRASVTMNRGHQSGWTVPERPLSRQGSVVTRDHSCVAARPDSAAPAHEAPSQTRFRTDFRISAEYSDNFSGVRKRARNIEKEFSWQDRSGSLAQLEKDSSMEINVRADEPDEPESEAD